MLQQHGAASPDPASAIKADYFTQRALDQFAQRSTSVLDSKYRNTAVQVPWEKERQRRVFRAITVGAVESVHPPYARSLLGESLVGDDFTRVATVAGLPTKQGPGSELSAERWGALILQSWPLLQSNYSAIVGLAAQRAANQQMAQVAVGLRRYQVDHGLFPSNLEELVPAYLPALPKQTGLPTQYSLAETEELVLPVLASNLITVGLPSETASWHVVSALQNLFERSPYFFLDNSETPGGGAGGALAMGAPGAMMMGGGPPAGASSLTLLLPHAVLSIGNRTRFVPTVGQR